MNKKIVALALTVVATMPYTVCRAEEVDTAVERPTYQAYEDGLVIQLGRMASAHTASTMYKGDTFENNPYTRYVQEKLNITFENVIEAEGEDYDKQITLATAAGDLPDMFMVRNYDTLVDLVDNDLICDLTSYYEEYATDYIKSIYDSYEGRCLDYVTFDGKLMALPGANPDNNTPPLCWVRKDWLDEIGFNPDEDGDLCITLEDVEATAKAFLDAGKGSVGLAVADSVGDAELLCNAMGGIHQKWLLNEDGTVEYSDFAGDATKNLWERMNQWYQDGLLDQQFGTRTYDDITSLMINNELGISFGAWHMSDWRLIHVKDANPEAEFIAYTVQDAEGKVNTYHENPAFRYLCVRKDYENPEAAIQILNVLYDDLARLTEESAPEVAQFIKDGGDNFCRPFQLEVLPIDNVAKYWVDHSGVLNGEITPEECQTSENMTTTAAMLTYLDWLENPEEEWTAETLAGWKAYTSRIIGTGASVNALNQNGNVNWISPVYPPTLPIKEQKMETLNTMMLQAFVKIVTGEEPVSWFDEFKEQWYANGGEEIIAEMEEYYVGK